MTIEATIIKDCYTIQPQVYPDERGYFMETFNQRVFEDATGIRCNFVQDNQSFSRYGVIRGLHQQKPPFAQAKLVRAVTGAIYDVVVDCRNDSATFGQWIGQVLSADNGLQLYIPKGCLHGFSVLSEEAVVAYKTDAFFSRDHESGCNYADPFLNINWLVPKEQELVSEKDRQLSLWAEVTERFNH